MTASGPVSACRELPPVVPFRRRRTRVVELLATGGSGGAQEHVSSLVKGLDRDHFDVRVVSFSDGAAVRRLRSAGFNVRVIGAADDGGLLRALVDDLRDEPPDVLHNHMYRAEIIGTRAALALADAGLRRPYVVSTVHSSRVRSAEDRELLRLLTPHIDQFIAVSRSIVAKIARERPGHAQVELIYNGVDLDRYSQQEACCTLPEEYGFAPGTPLVGVVARLEPEKGHPTLLDAWARVVEELPGARLLVVGEGSRRDALEEQAAALDLLGPPCEGDACVGTLGARPGAKVVFTGRRDDVPAVTAALDVAVLPSYREAQGLTILEAMALRRPVVATSVGGIPEMVEDGRTGLLVPPRDPDALAAAIVRLLTDHPYADQLARNGYELAHERFCVQRMVRAIEEIYQRGARAAALRRARSASAA